MERDTWAKWSPGGAWASNTHRRVEGVSAKVDQSPERRIRVAKQNRFLAPRPAHKDCEPLGGDASPDRGGLHEAARSHKVVLRGVSRGGLADPGRRSLLLVQKAGHAGDKLAGRAVQGHETTVRGGCGIESVGAVKHRKAGGLHRRKSDRECRQSQLLQLCRKPLQAGRAP